MNEGWVFIVGADWVGIVDQRDGFRIGKMERLSVWPLVVLVNLRGYR